tara:strand:+ start:402 stop:1472 length:1071 start_codon:yes stop_codon:yes gene_type:complete
MSGPKTPKLIAASFSELLFWDHDNHSFALEALINSCPVLEKKGTKPFGDRMDWKIICRNAKSTPKGNSKKARIFFELSFELKAVQTANGSTGLITGYYEPLLRGSLKRSPLFNVPIYSHPNDLLIVDLGKFKSDLKGKKIFGRIHKGTLSPYYDRSEIERGMLAGKNLEIVWLDSLVDAFFLHIQGSGRILLNNGNIIRVGYAGSNGHSYSSIGKRLILDGEIRRSEMSMQTIKRWMKKNADKASALMHKNKSFIFFKEINGPGPIGALGVPLTPLRSIAVDKNMFPLGLPIWLETTRPDGIPFNRLMVAQDTGSAILGAVRADIFWGFGSKAEDLAGKMKSSGRYFLLVPRQRTK